MTHSHYILDLGPVDEFAAALNRTRAAFENLMKHDFDGPRTYHLPSTYGVAGLWDPLTRGLRGVGGGVRRDRGGPAGRWVETRKLRADAPDRHSRRLGTFWLYEHPEQKARMPGATRAERRQAVRESWRERVEVR